MKRILLCLLFLQSTLIADWSDRFSSNVPCKKYFVCPYHCGSWGTTGAREVEWQFILTLWELHRLSAASQNEDFCFSKPTHFDDPWYQNIFNENLLITSNAVNCSERLNWNIEHHDEDGAHQGKTFHWTYYTDFGSGERHEDWGSHQFDNLENAIGTLESVAFQEEMIFFGHIEEVYSHEFKLIEIENSECESLLRNNKINLQKQLDFIEKCELEDPSYTSSFAEKRANNFTKNISKYEKQLAENKKRLVKLEKEYASKSAAYTEFHPYFSAQLQKVKDTYLNIFTHCIEEHEAPSALYTRSQIHFLDGYFMDCLADLSRLLEITSLETLKEKTEEDLLLRKGQLQTQLGLFDEAIQTLTSCIRENPKNKESYFERAVAYFEKGNFELSIADFLQADYKPKPTIGTVGLDFCAGLISGICISAGDTTIHFIPSMLSSISGLAHGLWAFACDPTDVSVQMYHACRALIDFLTDHSTLEVIQTLVPEVKELMHNSKTLSERRKGELIGSIIGRYGTDFLLFAGIGKGVKVFHDLQRANRFLTLEKMAKDASKWTTLEEIHQAWWKKTKSTLDQIKVAEESKLSHALGSAFKNECLSELQVRKILHHCGYKTFPRPKGIPQNWKIMISEKGGGMKYRLESVGKGGKTVVHAEVRIMPGNPISSNPLQQQPYAKHSVHGKSIDKNGKFVDASSPSSHIPLQDYDFEKLSRAVPYG
ncbi:MAG: hypothetical protein H7A42_02245 [Chlamydiales bacterium]|nr:hypothetical protein [Chlamydiales bacterium]